MRQLLMLAAVAGLAMARPEVYREKEDFQFSRSSTDEGSKSGYYGAQRGNMGGNYERAHNMDPLAQNQMSGLVRTVEGELGDGAKQPTGSVYTSANTRGVYGSGNYDLSNLAGRNFQEGMHGLQSHSSLTSHLSTGYNGQHLKSNLAGYMGSQSLNSDYRRTHDSRYDGYNSAGNSAQVLYSNNHGSDSFKPTSQFEDRTLAQNTGYSQAGGYSQAAGYSQTAGYQGQVYDQGRSLSHTSNGYGSNIDSRLVSGNPVKIVIRPGTKVIVPLATQTYDASQSTSAFDQNAINSETEVLNGNGRSVVLKPTSKQHESSYSYRKEWEKHDTKPVSTVVPLSVLPENSYPANSELYEDTQARTLRQQRPDASRISSQVLQSSHNGYNIASQSQHSSHSGYNVNSASSSQSRQTSDNAQHHSSDANTGYSTSNGAYNADSNGAYNAGMSANNRKIVSGTYIGTTNDLNQVEDSNTKPKSYHSAYSYHKSWERQGDPYVIKPSTNGLGESISIGPYTSHQYVAQQQSHQGYSRNGDDDCDEHGQVRVARSPSSHHHQVQIRGDVDMGQQTQQQWDNLEDLGQQSQSKLDNLEEHGQQTQNNWDQFGQQTESKWDKLQDEGQQTQTLWGQQETQKQWDQHDVGQETQNTWDKLELEPQRQTELGQQTQDTWTALDTKPSEADSSRQSNHNLNKDHQLNENTFEIAQSSSDQKHNTESHTLESGTNKTSSHHVHTIWDEIKKEEIGQENEHSLESDLTQAADLGQQTQVSWGNINQNGNSFNPWHHKVEDQSEVDLTNSQQNDNFFVTPNPHPWMYNQVHQRQDNRSDSNQYFGHSSSSSSVSGFHSQEHSTNTSSSFNSNVQAHSTGSTFGSSVTSLWDKLENMEKQTILSHGTGDKDNLNVEHQDTASDFGKPAPTNVFESHTTVKPQKTITTAPNSNPIPPPGDKVLSHDIGRGDIEPEVSSNSDDIGRGDIEPENSSSERYKPVELKPYKNPSEIGVSGIIKVTDEVDNHDIEQDKNKEDARNLSVLSLDQQSHTEHQNMDTQNMWQSGASITTVKNTIQSNYMHHNENMHHINEETENHNNNVENQFKNQDQQNLNQQTIVHQFVDSHENQNANTDQQLVNFGQQSDNHVHNIGQSEEIRAHNAEELGQETEQFGQVSFSGWKPDDDVNQQEHNFGNWGNENLEQQSQSGWTENLEQQVQTAWKPTDDLQQQSQLTDTFGPEEFNQQVQSAWTPAKDLQQQSQLTEPLTQPIEDLNQQVQTAWKPIEDMHQQSPMIDKSSLQVNQNEEIFSHKQPEVIEELIVPKKVTVIDSPLETESVTEKPSFWKSVGSKFTSAKDTVSSWFSS